MRSARVRIEQFDAYDRFLLWTAMGSGHGYVVVKHGAQGYWVADLPRDEPAGLDPAVGPHARLMRLAEIEGLAGSAPPPAVEPGPWLQSIGLAD